MRQNFIGVYHYSMDAKNRLAIPSKFRGALQGQSEMVLSQGLEGCLNLYTTEAWARLNEKLESLPIKNKVDQRAFKRMLFASASNVEFDEEGRILVPQILAGYAELKKDAVIIGMGEKIEVWAQPRWMQYQKKQQTAFAKHATILEI